MDENKKKIAVLVPCYNEEKTIGKVIEDFKKVLQEVNIFFFYFISSDN